VLDGIETGNPDMARRTTISDDTTGGNVFADLGLPRPELVEGRRARQCVDTESQRAHESLHESLARENGLEQLRS
jgi:hypothetical protein